jgi:hypothetical protein
MPHMDAPPDVPPDRKLVPDWLREGLFIVVSIGLAFAVDEFRESRGNRDLEGRALRSVAAELEHNLAQIGPFVDIHRRWAEALAQANTSQDRQNALDVYVAVRPRLPEGARANFPTHVRRVAWDAALSTGALRFIDYDLVAAVSEVYAMQDYYGDTAKLLGGVVTGGPAMDPAASAIAVRQMTVVMREVVFAEELLVDLYRRQLPVVQAAASR